jgi:hypothetical protein
MGRNVEIEEIEEMRRIAGINDIELRQGVRALRSGDFVRLTLLSGEEPGAAETVRVRITRVRGNAYRGKLADEPAARRQSGLHEGSSVAFTASQIHSLLKRPLPA